MARRPRLHIDVSEANDANVRRLADRFYRGVLADVVRDSLSLFDWVIQARLAGKRVIAVESERLPEAYSEPVVPGLEEAMNQEWRWLVARDHPWRRQLWIKGRKIAAGDLARTIQTESWSPEEAARQYDLDVEAVLEALRYAEQEAQLIAAEEAENRMAAERYRLEAVR
jgi:uncharacterized protein (DUF433 family)